MPKINIFRRGSTTFYYSSLLFPPAIRNQVTTLYAFVRSADDLVDTLPPLETDFHRFKHEYLDCRQGGRTANPIVYDYHALETALNLPTAWMDAFLAAMAQDLRPEPFPNLSALEAYMYGSAEVIGLIMARILELPEAALPYARLLGKSFQYANFIRDIAEDNSLGRQYLPVEDMKACGLDSLAETEALAKPGLFRTFIRSQIDRYHEWIRHAAPGFTYIPMRYRVPIQTAADMYTWTLDQISQDPLIVFQRKIKPRPIQVLTRGFKNVLPK